MGGNSASSATAQAFNLPIVPNREQRYHAQMARYTTQVDKIKSAGGIVIEMDSGMINGKQAQSGKTFAYRYYNPEDFDGEGQYRTAT